MSLESKIDKLLEGQNELKVEIARALVHQENHAKEIKALKEYKEKDEAFKNKAVGGLAILSLLGSAITGFITFVTKHN